MRPATRQPCRHPQAAGYGVALCAITPSLRSAKTYSRAALLGLAQRGRTAPPGRTPVPRAPRTPAPALEMPPGPQRPRLTPRSEERPTLDQRQLAAICRGEQLRLPRLAGPPRHRSARTPVEIDRTGGESRQIDRRTRLLERLTNCGPRPGANAEISGARPGRSRAGRPPAPAPHATLGR